MKTLSPDLANLLADALHAHGVFFRAAAILKWEPWHARAAAMWTELEHVASIPFDEFVAERALLPYCRVCGCSDDDACPGGCYWVEPDLCSACAGAAKEPAINRA